MATPGFFEALQYFRETWMRISANLAGALRGNINSNIKSPNDCPGDFIERKEPPMRAIVEFVGRNRLQDVPGQIIFNFDSFYSGSQCPSVAPWLEVE
jgi:hypothetical protein